MGIRAGARDQGRKKIYLKDKGGKNRKRIVAQMLSNDALEKAIESGPARQKARLQRILLSRR